MDPILVILSQKHLQITIMGCITHTNFLIISKYFEKKLNPDIKSDADTFVFTYLETMDFNSWVGFYL